MKMKVKKPIARILITVLMLTQLSALFPMFSLFNMVSEAASLTTAQTQSFDNQKWLIDEIIRQVRLTRPTVNNISQVTLEELQSITIINLDDIVATGVATGQAGHIPSGIGLLTNLTNLTVTNTNSLVLTGSIPTEIGNLTKLQILDLRSNNLTGSIPSEVGTLTNLTYLNLSDNNLSGNIPASILSNNLNKVTYLSLANNNLSGTIPNPTGVMTELLELNLSNNNLSGPLPSRFVVGTNATNHAFLKLKNINLSHNPLNVAATSVFTNSNQTLEYIDLSYCRINW